MSYADGALTGGHHGAMRAFTLPVVAGLLGSFLVAAWVVACGSTGSPAQPAGPGSPGGDDAQADAQSDVGRSDATSDTSSPDGGVVDAGTDAPGD